MPRRAISFVWFVTVFFLLSLSAMGKTIHVPADQPTIQAGINAAVSGDTVLVSAGTYYENINFNGKAITVTSVSGPAATVIDGSKGNSPAVLFSSNEKLSSVISGFTLQNGNQGVVYISGASPTISGNVVTSTSSSYGPSGIYAISGGGLLQGNLITNTYGGINSDFDTGLQIVGNVIVGVNETAVSLYGSEGTEVVQQNSHPRERFDRNLLLSLLWQRGLQPKRNHRKQEHGVRLGGGYRSAHRRQQHHC